MNQSSGNAGISKLAGVLQGQTNRSQDTSLLLDFGTIQGDYSLRTNTYPIPIPSGDYLVLRHLTVGAAGASMASTSETDGHTHAVAVPAGLASVAPGDRVLVGWIQNDAVVLGVIVPAGNIK